MSQIIKVIDVLENKISLENARQQVLFHKNEVFTYFDEGCTRYVYVNKDKTKVIKLLKNNCGKNYNHEEVEIYNNAKDKSQLVKTTIFNGLIEQEYVTPIKWGGKKLSISQRVFASSCRNEVGWDKDGNLLCFDLDEFKKY